jgi:acyl-CoA thioester hydrolase
MTGPRVTPFPADIAQRIAAMAKAHAVLPLPERAGRSIAIRRRG